MILYRLEEISPGLDVLLPTRTPHTVHNITHTCAKPYAMPCRFSIAVVVFEVVPPEGRERGRCIPITSLGVFCEHPTKGKDFLRTASLDVYGLTAVLGQFVRKEVGFNLVLSHDDGGRPVPERFPLPG